MQCTFILHNFPTETLFGLLNQIPLRCFITNAWNPFIELFAHAINECALLNLAALATNISTICRYYCHSVTTIITLALIQIERETCSRQMGKSPSTWIKYITCWRRSIPWNLGKPFLEPRRVVLNTFTQNERQSRKIVWK